MLSSFSVRGFKSLRDATLHLEELTLLVGWNASGKSNVLEALELLCWTSRAPRLSDLSHAVEQRQVRLRGNLRDLAPFGQDSDTIGFSCAVVPNPREEHPLTSPRLRGLELGRLELEMDVKVSARGLVLHRECLRAPTVEALNFKQPLYDAVPAGPDEHDVLVRYQNFRRGSKPTVEATADQPCFVQFTTPTRFQAAHEESRELIPLATRRIRDVLSDVRILDPAPRAMRGYAFRDDDQLHLTGDNLSAVLHKLVEEGAKDELLAFVAELPEQRIEDLDFLPTPRNEVMVVLREAFGPQRHDVPAALMSDGTLRVLAIAAALLSAPVGALVVIEEIDNGVHPSRAAGLLRTILATARRRGLRVLITTHNPALQDALPEESLGSVTLAYRHPSTGHTELTRLGDLPSFPRIAAAGPLGRLVTERSFERMVKESGRRPSVDLSWLRRDDEDGEGT